MDMVSKYGLTVLAMKVSGEIMLHAEEENSSILMVMSMMANGQMIKPTDTEFTLMQMAHATRVNGLMINNMEKEKKHGSMAVNTTDTT